MILSSRVSCPPRRSHEHSKLRRLSSHNQTLESTDSTYVRATCTRITVWSAWRKKAAGLPGCWGLPKWRHCSDSRSPELSCFVR